MSRQVGQLFNGDPRIPSREVDSHAIFIEGRRLSGENLVEREAFSQVASFFTIHDSPRRFRMPSQSSHRRWA